MKFYIHIGQKTVIDSCPKSPDHLCSVGPFDTLVDAQQWVDNHERSCASSRSHRIETSAATDPRNGVEK